MVVGSPYAWVRTQDLREDAQPSTLRSTTRPEGPQRLSRIDLWTCIYLTT
jgi:hypothetical protein